MKRKPLDSPSLFARHEIEIETVTTLTRRIKKAIDSEIGSVKVRGEISNYKVAASGHLYFSLKDEVAVIAAVMFKTSAIQTLNTLCDGIEVIATGKISIYEPRGQYQLIVEKLETIGSGDLQRRYEILKQKLLAEGLFEASRKKPLPLFPKTIALITSETAAALQDIIRVFSKRAPGLHLLIYDTRVQGAEAPTQIINAIQKANRDAKADLIILTRGGGSLEDLWAFNEEAVVRAIAQSTIPTITGIGHETDFTLADFAADLRAPTPSAAAEMALRDWAEWRDEINNHLSRLKRIVLQLLTIANTRYQNAISTHIFRDPTQLFIPWIHSLQIASDGIDRAVQTALQNKFHQFDRQENRWKAYSPHHTLKQKQLTLQQFIARLELYNTQATLKRGFALIQNGSGDLISSRAHVEKGMKVQITWHDGKASAEITQDT